jgi:hypothetical protein
MIRNLKVLGLALVAVFAMSAVAASAASAATPGEFTSDGTVTVTGTSVGESFTFEAGQKVVCNGDHTIGLQNVTPHAAFNPGIGVTTLTDKPHFTNCIATVGATSLPATVTTNGCDFLFHIGETTAPLGTGTYTVTPTVLCEKETESIEIHVYQNATHATSVCTYKVPAQGVLPGLHATNVAGGTIKVSGTVTGITASRTGVVCGGPKETNAAIQHANTSVGGKNAGGGATAIEITD